MSHVTLFPRLSRFGVRSMLLDDELLTKPFIHRFAAANSYIQYESSGGIRADNFTLQKFSDRVFAIAKAHGFPGRGNKSDFDAELTIWLCESLPISYGEALRDDVWAFISTCLLPELVSWRYGNVPERFHGGVRNTFQRLWLRGQALDRGHGADKRWLLMHALSEDATVQIIERPSVAADSRLALSIGEAWVRTAQEIGTARMEGVTRAAVKNLRIANEVLNFSALDDSSLDYEVHNYFRVAAGL